MADDDDVGLLLFDGLEKLFGVHLVRLHNRLCDRLVLVGESVQCSVKIGNLCRHNVVALGYRGVVKASEGFHTVDNSDLGFGADGIYF